MVDNGHVSLIEKILLWIVKPYKDEISFIGERFVYQRDQLYLVLLVSEMIYWGDGWFCI